jgi:hypothetical protein
MLRLVDSQCIEPGPFVASPLVSFMGRDGGRDQHDPSSRPTTMGCARWSAQTRRPTIEPPMTRLSHPGKLARHAAWYRVHDKLDRAELIERALNASGRCRICGRELADPESIAIGIGPECRKKFQATAVVSG